MRKSSSKNAHMVKIDTIVFDIVGVEGGGGRSKLTLPGSLAVSNTLDPIG